VQFARLAWWGCEAIEFGVASRSLSLEYRLLLVVTLRQVVLLFSSRSLRLTASSITCVQARLAGLRHQYQR
jgi:hypothetical protein